MTFCVKPVYLTETNRSVKLKEITGREIASLLVYMICTLVGIPSPYTHTLVGQSGPTYYASNTHLTQKNTHRMHTQGARQEPRSTSALPCFRPAT